VYKLAAEVEDLLRKRKFPIPVMYGPERFPLGVPFFAIVVERDRAASDRVSPVAGSQRNPRKQASRLLAVRATVFARSEYEGARLCEHEDLCEQIVDALICAVSDWSMAHAHHLPDFVDARYVTPTEAGLLEQFPGVVYVLRWTIPRGVFTADFLGDGLPVGTVGDTNISVVRITRNGSHDPPETIP
jgi:hypothetical protein